MVSPDKKGNGRSPFPFSCDNKRYHTLHYHLRTLFPYRVGKAVIDGGFTCPNIDGSKGWGRVYLLPAGAAENLRKAPSFPLRNKSKRNFTASGKNGGCGLHRLFSIPYQYLRPGRKAAGALSRCSFRSRRMRP